MATTRRKGLVPGADAETLRVADPVSRIAMHLLLAVVMGLPGQPSPAVECASGGSSSLELGSVSELRSYRAAFQSPTRLAVDAQGTIYVADPAAAKVVVRDPDGSVIAEVTGLGYPVSIAVVPDGSRIYIGDGIEGEVVAYTQDWQRLFSLGAGARELAFPGDIALDNETKHVWVTDSLAHRVKQYDWQGSLVRSIGAEGSAAGQFRFPMGIFVDTRGAEILVVDQVNARIQILDREGNFKFCLGGKGSSGGQLNMPQGIWADEVGRIYVADAFEAWVKVLDRTGALVAHIGDFGSGAGRLSTPTDLLIDPFGRLFVTSSSSSRLEIFGLESYTDPERVIPAVVAVSPERLDASVAVIATIVLEVPGYRLSEIELSTLTVNGLPVAAQSIVTGDADNDAVPDLLLTMDAGRLAATLPSGSAAFFVSGRLGDYEIEGFDVVTVPGGTGSDRDHDGVPDSEDQCAGTRVAEAVDVRGCSLDQLCPCFGPSPGEGWTNHGEYVQCVAQRVFDIVRPPLDRAARVSRVKEAARSDCGRRTRGGK